MDLFLETETPDDLVRHLFLSFVQSPHKAIADGKTLKVRERRATGEERHYLHVFALLAMKTSHFLSYFDKVRTTKCFIISNLFYV